MTQTRAALPDRYRGRATIDLRRTCFADDCTVRIDQAGTSGYVLKQIRGGNPVRTIRSVGQGSSLLDPAVTATVLERLRKGKHLVRHERPQRLSAQEERILMLVAEGHTNRELGVRLARLVHPGRS